MMVAVDRWLLLRVLGQFERASIFENLKKRILSSFCEFKYSKMLKREWMKLVLLFDLSHDQAN